MALTLEERIFSAREKLAAVMDKKYPAVIGFDGFVDEIIDVVDKRTSATQLSGYTRIETISALAARISKAAGLSTNIELVPRLVKLGGNGPIMANALSAMGMVITYVGALGKPAIHPVFQELVDKAERVISFAEPAHTDALEFTDGKVMLGKHLTVMDVNWENLTAMISVAELRDIFRQARLIATVNWTMLPFMTDMWRHLLAEVLPALEGGHPPLIFFDLADPEKKPVAELVTALRTIEQFNTCCRPVLGLNLKEAHQVAAALEITLKPEASLEEITKAIAGSLKVYGVVVHPTKGAACMVDGTFAEVAGPYTSKPKLTTGAGDNFNAGFCLGLMLDLPPADALVTGVGTSGFYVRNGRSPSRAELLSFLDLWRQNCDKEF
ncbi:MAG TPA: hypothetical protein GXX29_08535 [Firmicutes bacterium]|nr:hypothetical protein [Bacillota bacterium]